MPRHPRSAAARLLVCLVLLTPVGARAAAPDPAALLHAMRVALWPGRPSTREITLTVSTDDGQTTEVVAGQAHKRAAGKDRMLTVVLSPADARGAAWLVENLTEGPPLQAVYIPAVRRVRKVVPAEGWQPFLDSDFTLADVGMLPIRARITGHGDAEKHGIPTWEVEEVPLNPWFYGRIVTWIAKDGGFPVERDFWDPAGQRWKVERFEEVTRVDGVPTILHFIMEDVLSGGKAEIRARNVRYDVDIPDDLLTSGGLPRAADARLWK